MSENKCPKCGASISENKQYCPHCGARLSLCIEAPKIIEKKAKPKKELSPKTKKRLKIAGIAAAAFAIIGTTIGILTPLVIVPSAQISEVKKGNIFSFNKIGDSYSVRANTSLKKYFSEYLPSEITIPNEYKGHPVTKIESFGFYYCSSLTSITIPDSVTSIGKGAFRDCSSLESITIPNSVISISDLAFYNCSSLTSITIPDSVTSIDEYAFSNCSSLTSIVIPDSVTSIGFCAFSDCSSLRSITIPFVGGNTTSSSRRFEDLFGGYVPTTLKEVIISDGCTSIGAEAFSYCSSLESITIPNSVISISNYAFEYCSSLTSITIPDSVTSIGDRAFEYCLSLTSITIPNSVASIGFFAFYECVNLDKVFYAGSEAKWSSISIDSGNDYLENSVYYYSEEEPTRLGNYWHYVDGVPTIW